jgi:hypothetical protein
VPPGCPLTTPPGAFGYRDQEVSPSLGLGNTINTQSSPLPPLPASSRSSFILPSSFLALFQWFKLPDFRSNLSGVEGFFLANFITGPGVTGWIMTVVLLVMVWFALEKQRRAHFER